jgi:hypothetical protein
MKRSITFLFFSLLVILSNSQFQCAAPGTVTVGVGVGVAGPWAGPYGYPGGTVWVGRPVGPVYYHLDPFDQYGEELVNISLDNPPIVTGN